MWNSKKNKIIFHPIGKLISYILFVLAVFFSTNLFIPLVAVGLLIVFCVYQRRSYSLYWFLFSFIVLTFSILEIIPTTIGKVVTLICYSLFVISSVTFEETKKIAEKLFYKQNSSKPVKKYIEVLYYPKVLKQNYKKYNQLSKDLTFAKNLSYYKGIYDIAKRQTVIEVEETIMLHHIRFYHTLKERTYYYHFLWKKEDNTFLLIHAVFFGIVTILLY